MKPRRKEYGFDARSVTRETYDAKVHQDILHNILSGRIAPGDKLPSEAMLAQAYEVSRPVVRKALQILRDEGFVDSRRGSGSFVVPQSALPHLSADLAANKVKTLNRLLAHLEFRMVIEPESAALAARRRTPKNIADLAASMEAFTEAQAAGQPTITQDHAFHLTIAIATDNEVLVETMRASWAQEDGLNAALRYRAHFEETETALNVLDEHRKVLSQIEQRDEGGARQTMFHHIRDARQRLMQSTFHSD